MSMTTEATDVRREDTSSAPTRGDAERSPWRVVLLLPRWRGGVLTQTAVWLGMAARQRTRRGRMIAAGAAMVTVLILIVSRGRETGSEILHDRRSSQSLSPPAAWHVAASQPAPTYDVALDAPIPEEPIAQSPSNRANMAMVPAGRPSAKPVAGGSLNDDTTRDAMPARQSAAAAPAMDVGNPAVEPQPAQGSSASGATANQAATLDAMRPAERIASRPSTAGVSKTGTRSPGVAEIQGNIIPVR